MSIDFGQVARELHLPLEKVERTVALLDEGNTVPFITRFRKDQIGGLDEGIVRAIQERIEQLRQLRDRKEKILRSIEAQGKLTPELTTAIEEAQTPKRLEDLYLPFKPRKQTLATIARERGLEPFAEEVLAGTIPADGLSARAAAYVSAEKSLSTTDEVLAGVGHLIAERFSEHAELRGRLRRIFQQSGRLICTKIEPSEQPVAAQVAAAATVATGAAVVAVEMPTVAPDTAAATEEQAATPETEITPSPEITSNSPAEVATPAVMPIEQDSEEAQQSPDDEEEDVADMTAEETEEETEESEEDSSDDDDEESADEESDDDSVAEVAEAAPNAASPLTASDDDALPAGRLFVPPATPLPAPDLHAKKKKKKKKKKVSDNAFKDYFNFQEAVNRVPPHRVLAINRGEKARSIRVRIEADFDAMLRETEQLVVPQDHPQAEFLRDVARDALVRLMIPSLEREIRRELTDWAESHAVDVFVRNLRKLMLQPPVRGGRVLAIDPGFKSGCRLIALDEFGHVLGHGVMFVVGKDERLQKSRHRLAEMIKLHRINFIAIGNGTGSREAEHLVAELLANEVKDLDVSYCIVNEAGASIYSTSQLGREELPNFDALQRGAISIGRRLLDPLSELVKINPANIGVGMYQHDVKAKHLKDSLDAVVESCVNFVGVDVNSASPALLRYVSGMNQLTARRVYEYRREHGPFRSREELKNVPGFGEATFVQSAGFLKVLGGDNPLDATWIHPESYDLATKVLSRFGSNLDELAKSVPPPLVPQKKQRTFFGIPLDEATDPAAPPAEAETAATSVAVPPVVTEEDVVAALPVDDVPPQEAVMVTNEDTGKAEPAVPAEELQVVVEPAIPAEELQTEVEPAIKSPTQAEIAASVRASLAERASQLDVPSLAGELEVGQHLLQDIIQSLIRPGLDPRDSLPPPIFRRGVMRLEDLEPGMELSGTVLNVVDFGAFVDIGLTDSGLVHISRLADRYIRDPHEVVSVGDVLKVWVVDVDKGRRRVSLTAIAPGSERPAPQRREKPQRAQRPPQGQGQGSAAPQGSAGAPPQQRAPQGGGRGDRPPPRRGGGGRGSRQSGPPQPQSIERKPTKPKVVKPLTKKMEEGKEPLRSFGDLLQFMDKKKKPDDPK